MKASIVVWPEDVLKQASQPINGVVDERVQKLIRTMVATLGACQTGIGLSAIQIGDPTRIFLIKQERGYMVIADPSYEGIDEKVVKMEGCLSFPGYYTRVPRFSKIKANYTLINPADFTVKNVVEQTMDGMNAHVFQHESEHLDGHVMLEYASTNEARKITNKLKKWKMKGWIYP